MNQVLRQRICRHCKESFTPNPHNWTRQHYCSKPECRKARKIKSHLAWLAKNPNHYKGPENVERVRQWRKDHPNWAKRAKTKPKPPPEAVPLHDLLQDSVTRNRFVIGLVSDLYGCALQDSVEKKMRSLILKGMKIQLAMAGRRINRRPVGSTA